MNQQQPQLNIDLKNTKSIETPEGNKIFQQGVLLTISFEICSRS
jgi:hypothetical protein